MAKFSLLLLCNFIALDLLAQTYPGGVSANMTVWMRADSDTSWSQASWKNDAPTSSRVFNTLPLSGSGAGPSVYATPAHFNFNPAIQFSGSSAYSSGYTYPVSTFYSSDNIVNAQVTYFGVSNSGDFDMVSEITSSSTSSPCNANRCNTGFRYNRNEFGNATLSISHTKVGSAAIRGGRRASNTTTGIVSYVNGASVTGDGSLFANSGASNFRFSIGEFPGYYFSDAIPEVLWYKSSLTAVDIHKVESYLALKYGVTLRTSGDASKDYIASDGSVVWNATTGGSFRHNVFGLGRDDNSANFHQRISHSVNNTGTTTTAGQYLVVSTNDNFTNLNSATYHPGFDNNLQFMTFADNGGLFEEFNTTLSGMPGYTVHRSSRIWQSQDRGAVGNLHYQFSGLPGSAHAYYMVVADDPGFTVNRHFIPLIVAGGVASAATNLNDNNVTYFTIARSLAVLPVTGLHVYANFNDSKAHIVWETATETNSLGFYVERSSNENVFSPIAFVKTKAVNGESHIRMLYEYSDATPLRSRSFYRIKQVDADGRFTFSAVVAVSRDDRSNVTIYPNPAAAYATISGLNGDETIEVFNTAGVKVKRLSANFSTTQLSLKGLSNGMYTIRIMSKGRDTSSYQLLKQD